ncbi:MAG: flagellar filament capping protein FliD [Verrucomicrobiota bacterium]|jgi:flagellar hook-associated protein 2|nr:flagellar filament capping protein FliD [Verrucomicrobiota bacterium]
MDLNVAGLASGFDWKTMVDQIADIERSRQRVLQVEQSTYDLKKNILTNMGGGLVDLENKAEALADTELYDSRTVNSSETHLTATASAGTASGDYKFDIYQMATAAKQLGTSDIGKKITATNSLETAGFSVAITAGTFTVDGTQITIATTDTVNDVISRITSNVSNVSANYDNGTDKISITKSSGTLVLGSATDTSNFLQATRLTNNGTSSVTSTHKLGGVNLQHTANAASFQTSGTAASGSFTINGVSISYAATDTIADILSKINSSSSSVFASYDAVNDRFKLTNKTDGDLGMTLADVSGGFLANSGLLGGTLDRGKNLIYRLNDGTPVINQGNTITEASTGITGLTVKPSKGSGASQLSTIDTGTEIITTKSAHGYKTGEAITVYTPGTVPGGLTANTSTYYVRSTGSNTFTLHTSETDANNNASKVNVTSSGSGDVYFLGSSPTSATVTIAKDTGKIKTAIADFVTQYNTMQEGIAEQVKITTAADGKVTTSTLSDERLVSEITSSLRSKIMGDVDSAQITGTIKRLESLGYTSNGYDNTITLSNSSTLDNALRENIGDVKAFFSTDTYGYANVVDDYLETLVGESMESGAMADRTDNLAKLSSDIDEQIANLERQVLANRQKMIDSFVLMEQAQAKINQDMQFIMSRFGSNSSQ